MNKKLDSSFHDFLVLSLNVFLNQTEFLIHSVFMNFQSSSMLQTDRGVGLTLAPLYLSGTDSPSGRR